MWGTGGAHVEGKVDEHSDCTNLAFLQLTKQFPPLGNCSASMLSCLRRQIKGDYSAWEFRAVLQSAPRVENLVLPGVLK